ncbi:MAG: metal ABC transporter permease [Kluyvera sp.]|uniref:metal ABC transporter permease n=1 Tax=Kluyvera sp. TaxID=1538228 RepID=UPI003A83718A
MIWHTFFQPFIEFGFMRRALVVCLALSLSTTILGVFLLLRRMSLMGDALSHAILPGVAVGYLVNGMSLLAMTVGGFIAGIAVALIAGWVSRRTPLKEDASFAGFYLGSLALGVTLGSLALGVTLVSLRGSNVDLLHLLFGSILAVDNDAALFVAGVASLTLISIALFYRGLVSEAFDSAWLQVNARWLPVLLHGLFLALLVLNLVAGFQVLGTLMAVGVMMLPAVAARCWAKTLPGILLLAALIGSLCAWLGLSLSWAANLPAGPSIVLTASGVFFVSVFFGKRSRLTVSWQKLIR